VGAFFTVLLPTALAMAGPVVIRKRYSLSRLVKNNEIAGFFFGTAGVIYAVLLAFAIVTVWEKFSEAELFVLHEAGALASLHRLSASDEPDATAMHAALDNYMTAVVEEEWPRMAEARESQEAAKALDALYPAAMRYGGGKPVAIGVEIMRELGNITQARRGRLHLAMGVVSSALWMMLIFGAALTIGFAYFFGLEDLRAQTTMTGGLSSIIFLGLFVIVSYNYPFTGDVSVEPRPIMAVVKNFRHG